MKQYELYKDSGIKWLGKIPSHWDIIPLKFNLSLKGRIGWNGLKSDEFKENSYAYLVTGQDFDKAEIDWAKCYQIDKDRYDEDPFIQLSNGDLLVTKDGTIGKVAKVSNLDKPACLNSGIFVVKQTKNAYIQDFLYWTFVSNQLLDFNNFNSSGSTIQHLYQNVFENMPLVRPSIPEQEKIASYLNYKVGQIDMVIAEKEQLSNELKKYRSAIINESVTKGLDHNVETKDSGIEWIGAIPKHWKKITIKRVISLLTDYDANGSFSDIAKNCNINIGKPYAWMVRATDLENKRYGIVPGNNYCDFETYKYLSKSSLSPEDILIAKRGDIGKSYIVPQCDVPMTLAPNTYLLVTKKEVIYNWYLYFYLQSEGGVENLRFLNKSTTLGALYKDDVKAMYIPLPPLDEQKTIAETIKRRIGNIDSTLAEIQSQIEDLKIFKSSIITEGITGKVDLRDWDTKKENV